jgi:hypothetical protein
MSFENRSPEMFWIPRTNEKVADLATCDFEEVVYFRVSILSNYGIFRIISALINYLKIN